MAIKLSELTVAEFIDLICGEFENLRSLKHSDIIFDKAVTLRNIIFEYKSIADPSSVKQYFSMEEEVINAHLEMFLFTMCSNFVDLNEHDHARDIMIEYGINAQTMNNQRVAAEVKSRVERAKSKVNELQNEKEADTPTSDEIRKQFDEQTAALMAHFKFQIDTSSMKTTVYAHLVARHNREIKAKLAAIKQK